MVGMGIVQKVILLGCGSFNPITNMHLRMFELARDALNKTGRYEVIAGLISPVSDGYVKAGLVKATHRCEMTRLAVASSDWLNVESWEAERSDWTPTRQVLDHLRCRVDRTFGVEDEHPVQNKKRRKVESANDTKKDTDPLDTWLRNLMLGSDSCSADLSNNVQVKLLCGADVLQSFGIPDVWSTEDMETILSEYGIVCVSRPNTDPKKFIYEFDLCSKYENNIHLVTEWMSNDLSATKIRRALSRGESVKYLIQDSVSDYIHKHHLYAVRPIHRNTKKSTPRR